MRAESNSNIKSFKDLTLWQRAKDFAVSVYKATEKFPRKEEFGISNQMRRAAVSIPSNIAEGFSRRSMPDKIHFLRIALGSCSELETQLIISKELGYLPAEGLIDELNQIAKMLNAAMRKML